jgi:hypothetical protein
MKLSDTQLVILQSGARDPERRCSAQPKLGQAPRQAIAKKLLAAGLVEATPWRTRHAPEFRFGDNMLRIAPAGLRAIGAEPETPAITTKEEKAKTAETSDGVSISDPALGEHPIAQENRTSWERPIAKAKVPERGAGRGFWRAAEAAAARGELPPAPDFSAPTHAPYRKKLDKLLALARAGDAAGLRAVAINPTSTTPKALARWRDLAVRAIETRGAGRP